MTVEQFKTACVGDRVRWFYDGDGFGAEILAKFDNETLVVLFDGDARGTVHAADCYPIAAKPAEGAAV